MNEKTKKRLRYLGDKIAKYAHRWGENPSDRMYRWVDEYNELAQGEGFKEYCEENGFAVNHDGYDLLA